MQIEPDRLTCPACGDAPLTFAAVLHHMLCAYVGPDYDFAPEGDGCRCPKCRRSIGPGSADCEIVGTSARCPRCDREMIVSQPRA